MKIDFDDDLKKTPAVVINYLTSITVPLSKLSG